METPQAVFDFHLHTCWSYDADAPVEYYFEAAEKLGVSHIAITEHHHMDSVHEALECASRHPGVTYIPGAELTVHSELGTFDMVCLGLPITPTEELQKVFDAYHQWQRDFGDATSAGFTAAGYPYSRENRLELLRRYRPERTIELQGITHVQFPLQHSYLIDERKYFKNRDGLNQVMWSLNLPDYPEASMVIPAVKKAGGLVFIAHPYHYFKHNDLNRMDALRELLDFDGIECAHDIIPPEMTPFYREYCLKHGLLSSGGTDCHTVYESSPLARFCMEHSFARHRGEKRYLDEILERLNLPSIK